MPSTTVSELDCLEQRDRETITLAIEYNRTFSHTGIPGHNLLIIISLLAAIIRRLEARAVRVNEEMLALREVYNSHQWDAIARCAFNAYKFTVGGTAVTGKPIPEWEDCGSHVRQGWIAAAQEARSWRPEPQGRIADAGETDWRGNPPGLSNEWPGVPVKF